MSIHVCKCPHNGREEYHLRYPGMTEPEAQDLADMINGGGLANLPSVLFDGFAVSQALDEKAKGRTSAENVSDVLDAVVRLMRSNAE